MPFRKGLQIYTFLTLNKIYFLKKDKGNFRGNFWGIFRGFVTEKAFNYSSLNVAHLGIYLRPEA
jgi:hypothetical protein